MTRGRPTGSWPRNWPRPATGWPPRTCAGTATPAWADWTSISRTDVAGDLLALIRHLGGPAVIVGHSLSGGAATIAAAQAPDLVSGIVEINPFTQRVRRSISARLLRDQPVPPREGSCWAGTQMLHSLGLWLRYQNAAYPTKPAD